jgi:polysaccharide deacetylase family protein (PEP-CTERM system associated)
LLNAFTVDVEDYFQVSAFASFISRDDWDKRQCRVERNVDLILALLEKHGAHATFFTLGWIAERYPELVRRIVQEGHELGSHGYDHHRATDQDAPTFFSDITRAKKLLEDMSGIVKSVKLGAEDFIFKPFNPTLLRARVTASLEKKALRDRTRD